MTLDFNPKSLLAERFVDLIDQAIDQTADRPRDYLGASGIGEPCARRLQYEFQGAPKDADGGFAPRTRRIFHRGHQGEEWMVQWIRAAGFELRTHKNGSQFGFDDCEGRFKGHIDGVVTFAPQGYSVPALWENKVLGSKGFAQLVKHGVAKAYPKYAAQIATYQAYMQLAENPAFFTALNADTMEIHLELVPFNAELAQECADKAARILEACDHGESLPRIAAEPDGFSCKFCPFKAVCWGAA